MTWVAVATAGSAIVGGVVSSNASKKAAKAQVAAADKASQTEREIFERQVQLQEPFRQAELAKQRELMQRLGVGGDNGSGNYGNLSSGFMPENWMAQMDPGYNFRLAEGLKALDHRLAASGMNASGAGLKAAARYGQDYASNEFMNAFNRYQTGRNATLNPLMGGSQATNTLTSALGNMGGRIAENQIGAGNAQAAGYVGGANAWTSAINNGVNSYLGYNMFNNLDSYGSKKPMGGSYYDPRAGYNTGALYPESLGGNGGL